MLVAGDRGPRRRARPVLGAHVRRVEGPPAVPDRRVLRAPVPGGRPAADPLASVARTSELMIRQDESTRRASGLVFFDTRADAWVSPTRRRSNGRSPWPRRSVSCCRGVGSSSGWARRSCRRPPCPRIGSSMRSPASRTPRSDPSGPRSPICVPARPGHLIGVRRGPARADRARRVDPSPERVRSQARGPGPRPTPDACRRATGTARRAGQPSSPLPRPRRVGRDRPAPVDEIAGTMALAAGTSPRAHRLIGLVATLLWRPRRPWRSVACSSGPRPP